MPIRRGSGRRRRCGAGAAPAFTGTATLSGSGALTVPPTTSGGTIVSTGAGVASISDVSWSATVDGGHDPGQGDPAGTVRDHLQGRRRAPGTDVTFLMDVGNPVTGQDEVYTARLDTEGRWVRRR
jgi:hypothetical protein